MEKPVNPNRNLEKIRLHCGRHGHKTSLQDFADECGFSLANWRGWERYSHKPQGGDATVWADGFARCEGVRARGLDSMELANWAWTSRGADPFEESDDPAPGPHSSSASVVLPAEPFALALNAARRAAPQALVQGGHFRDVVTAVLRLESTRQALNSKVDNTCWYGDSFLNAS